MSQDTVTLAWRRASGCSHSDEGVYHLEANGEHIASYQITELPRRNLDELIHLGTIGEHLHGQRVPSIFLPGRTICFTQLPWSWE